MINKKYINNAIKLKKEFERGWPIKHIILKNFFDTKLIEEVSNEMMDEEMVFHDTDLYKFWQTKKDLKSSEYESLRKLSFLLNSKKFKDFVKEITGIDFNGNVDSSGFFYEKTHYILPHDDRLEKRKLAYSIYLSQMSKEDGGSLDFYDEKKIVKSITPTFNTIIIFEVIEGKSFHQVSEIIKDRVRVSISGWFNDK